MSATSIVFSLDVQPTLPLRPQPDGHCPSSPTSFWNQHQAQCRGGHLGQLDHVVRASCTFALQWVGIFV